MDAFESTVQDYAPAEYVASVAHGGDVTTRVAPDALFCVEFSTCTRDVHTCVVAKLTSHPHPSPNGALVTRVHLGPRR